MKGIEIEGVRHELVPTKFIILLYGLAVFFGTMFVLLTLHIFGILPLYSIDLGGVLLELPIR